MARAPKKPAAKKPAAKKGSGDVLVRWLRTWAAEAIAAQKDRGISDDALGWVTCTQLYTMQALLAPHGDTAKAFEAVEQKWLKGDAGTGIADLARLAEAKSPKLGAGRTDLPPIEQEELSDYCSGGDSARAMLAAGQPRGAFAASIYGSCWLLSHRSCSAGLRELLEIPLRAARPGFFEDSGKASPLADNSGELLDAGTLHAAIDRALRTLRAMSPGASIDLSSLDYSSVVHFCASFQDQLRVLDLSADAAPAEAAGAAPNWKDAEQIVYDEVKASITLTKRVCGKKQLALFVLWADPYNGSYEVVVDTLRNNQKKVRSYNEQLRTVFEKSAASPKAWQKAMSLSTKYAPLDYCPDVNDFEYEVGEGEIHDFKIDLESFVRSEAYAKLNVGGEDGYLEGHFRFVIAAALRRLIEEGAFDKLNLAPVFRVGYCYPDTELANVVGVMTS